MENSLNGVIGRVNPEGSDGWRVYFFNVMEFLFIQF